MKFLFTGIKIIILGHITILIFHFFLIVIFLILLSSIACWDGAVICLEQLSAEGKKIFDMFIDLFKEKSINDLKKDGNDSFIVLIIILCLI